MRLVIYTRVSTDAQDRSGLGEEGQVAACLGFASAEGAEVVAVVHDALSGKVHPEHRAGLSAALMAIEAGRADAVLVYDLSRLTRSVLHFAELLEERMEGRGGRWLSSVRERTDLTTARGREIAYADAVRAQGEREQTSERTTRALAAKVARGERLGRPPFGFRALPGRDDFTRDPQTWPLVVKIRRLRAEGQSMRAIAGALGVNHRLVGRVLARSAA